MFLRSIKSAPKGLTLVYYENDKVKNEFITWREFTYDIDSPLQRDGNGEPWIAIKKNGKHIGNFYFEKREEDIYDLSYKLTRLKHDYLYGKGRR